MPLDAVVQPSAPRIDENTVHGSAVLRDFIGTPLAPAIDFNSSSIVMGSDEWNGSTGFIWDLKKLPGHGMTFGPTRKGGKGVSAIIPALLTYTAGSRLVIDPKGENYFAVKERAEAAGHRVVLMDPWNEANRRYGSKIGVSEPVTKYNPLSSLDPTSRDFADDVAAVADALILVPDTANKHFDESARELVSGCIAAAVEGTPGTASLRDVRQMLTMDDTDLAQIVGQIVEGNPHSLAGRKLRRFAPKRRVNKKGEALPVTLSGEMGSIRSTAETQTAFLDSETLLDSMETDHPPFDLSELATGKVSLFLVLPVDRLETHGRWMRLIITLAIRAIARQETPPANPVLFLLDEMGTIGRLSMVETAFGLMAGLGIRLWGFLQDLAQLQGLYKQTWETFISNSSVVQILKAHDPTTSEYVSRYLGNGTVNAKTGGWSYKQARWANPAEWTEEINKRVAKSLKDRLEAYRYMSHQKWESYESKIRNMVEVAGPQPIKTSVPRPESWSWMAERESKWYAHPANPNKPELMTPPLEPREPEPETTIKWKREAREGAEQQLGKEINATEEYRMEWVPDEQLMARPLLDPDEVRRLPDENCLLLMPGAYPIRQFRTIYYQHPLFRGLYRANPYFAPPDAASSAR